MKTLYVTDLDGTLLGRDRRVSPFSREVLNALAARGVLFTYATARSAVSAAAATEGLLPHIPVIAYNGTFLIDPQSGQPVAAETLGADVIADVIALLHRHDATPLVYAMADGREQVSWLQGKENDGVRAYLAQRKGDPRLHPVTEASALYAGEIFYFTCIGPLTDMQPLYEALRGDERCACTLTMERSGEYWCEIMPRHANKAEAVLRLKEMLGCDQVVCFGDGLNDLPMFRVADEAYAVANALPEVKAAATGIIASNEEDGVAKWLRQHCELPR